MNRAIDNAKLVASVRDLAPWTGDLLVTNETHPSADLLHRTISGYALPEWPEGFDRLDLERQARQMRNDYLAQLVGRLVKMLTGRSYRGQASGRVADPQLQRGMP